MGLKTNFMIVYMSDILYKYVTYTDVIGEGMNYLSDTLF